MKIYDIWDIAVLTALILYSIFFNKKFCVRAFSYCLFRIASAKVIVLVLPLTTETYWRNILHQSLILSSKKWHTHACNKLHPIMHGYPRQECSWLICHQSFTFGKQSSRKKEVTAKLESCFVNKKSFLMRCKTVGKNKLSNPAWSGLWTSWNGLGPLINGLV